MQARVFIIADLRPVSKNRELALNVYRAFEASEVVDAAFLYTPDQEKSMDDVRTVIDLPGIKNSIIILMREIPNFYKIDRSNIVVYLANNGFIEQYMSFMLYRVDRIMVTDYKSAYRLASATRHMNMTIPIHKLDPWYDLSAYKLHELKDEKLKVLINGDDPMLQMLTNTDANVHTMSEVKVVAPQWEVVENPEISDYDVYIHLVDDDPEPVRVAMAHGVVPIVYNKLPFTEFIVNNMNGFTVTLESDLAAAVSSLSTMQDRETYQALTMKSIQVQISADVWATSFVRTVYGTGNEDLNDENLFNHLVIGNRWIVPKIELIRGQKTSIPRNYNKDRFLVVPDVNDLEDILMYFVSQRFLGVYIFDWDYGDYDDEERRNRILNMVRAIGRRGINMHWCTDSPIDKKWAAIFNNMTILPISEGLKRVASPVNQKYIRTS